MGALRMSQYGNTIETILGTTNMCAPVGSSRDVLNLVTAARRYERRVLG